MNAITIDINDEKYDPWINFKSQDYSQLDSQISIHKVSGFGLEIENK